MYRACSLDSLIRSPSPKPNNSESMYRLHSSGHKRLAHPNTARGSPDLKLQESKPELFDDTSVGTVIPKFPPLQSEFEASEGSAPWKSARG